MTKEEIKEYMKQWRASHKGYGKEYYKSHKQQCKAAGKEYYESHKEARLNAKKEWRIANKEYAKEYRNKDLNLFGKTKNSIRCKSYQILKRMNLCIPGYEIHHCFGYEDANKFIYISKSLHLKIHKYLRDNNIDADINHWIAIRNIVNSTEEFTYIKY